VDRSRLLKVSSVFSILKLDLLTCSPRRRYLCCSAGHDAALISISINICSFKPRAGLGNDFSSKGRPSMLFNPLFSNQMDAPQKPGSSSISQWLEPSATTSIQNAVQEHIALITAAPELRLREAIPEPQNGADTCSQAEQSASQAIQQANQQASNSVQQASGQFSQSADAASRSASQAIQQAQQSATQAIQQAQQSASQAIQQAQQSMGQSVSAASRSVSAAQQSASQAAASASSVVASAQSFAAQAISLANGSAQSAQGRASSAEVCGRRRRGDFEIATDNSSLLHQRLFFKPEPPLLRLLVCLVSLYFGIANPMDFRQSSRSRVFVSGSSRPGHAKCPSICLSFRCK